jgi:hypothetical protein
MINFILYSSDTCHHCIEFRKSFGALQEKLKSKFDITFTEFVFQKDGDKFDSSIEYFPFIKIIINGTTYIYTGDRSYEDIERFIGNYVKPIEHFTDIKSFTFEPYIKILIFIIILFLIIKMLKKFNYI